MIPAVWNGLDGRGAYLDEDVIEGDTLDGGYVVLHFDFVENEDKRVDCDHCVEAHVSYPFERVLGY